MALAFAQDVDGFAELRLQTYAGLQTDVPLTVVERFRPTFTAPLGSDFMLSTTIEAGLSQGWRSREALRTLMGDAGIQPAVVEQLGPEPTNKVLSVSNAGNYLAVDRLFADYYTDVVDVRVGRQALNWGSAFVVNPTDPFPEVLLTEPWRPRSGVNAVKVVVPLGGLNNASLVVASDDAFVHPRVAGRVTVNALQADWSLVGAYRDDARDGVVGLDVKGTAGVGYWFEGVVRFRPEEMPAEEFAAGLDYSLPIANQQLLATAQYYRNGLGSSNGGVARGLLGDREPFAPAFSGRDYLMASVSGGLNDDLSFSALWMQNLGDGTAFVVPSLSLAVAGPWDLSLAAQLPFDLSGTGGEFAPSDEALLVSLPGADGPSTVDFRAVVPTATLILWTRVNF